MASLPTQDEVEEELEFQEVLIMSLDSGADDYPTRLAELEAKKHELERTLETLQSGGRPQAAARQDRSGQSHMNGMDGAHDWWQSVTNGRPVSSTGQHGHPQNAQASAMKRPLPQSLQPESQHPSKRATPEPSNAATPASSVESFEGGEHPRAEILSERARMRQMQAEALLRRQSEAQRADEQFARSLNQQQGHSRSPYPSSSSSSLMPKPTFQATLNHNGSYQRPPAPSPIEPPTMDRISHHSSSRPQSFGHHPQTPTIKSEPSSSRQHHRLAKRPRNPEVVDLTNSDSEDEVNEIAPNGFTPNDRAQRNPYNNNHPYAGHPVQHMSGHSPMPGMQHQQRSMPGSYPTPDQLVYGNGANSNALRRQYPWMQQSNPMLTGAVNGIRNMAGSLGDTFTELGNLIRNHGEDDIIYGGSRPRHPTERLYAGYDDHDLYRRRYDEIQNYDPAKTTEEINALLENIRPDEEMPAHLRVQTPEAMAIKLHKYQELGLTWLQKCEEGSNKGGILADDMGLGKTIQMLSLMVTRKSEEPRCKTTLIVAPVALMRQWQQEIEQKVKPRHKLSVFVQHGQSKKKSFKDLQHYDVVLTTFGSLAAELKKLEKFEVRRKEFPETRPSDKEKCALISEDAKWYRVILDEAQCIKNTNTQTSKAACRLDSKYRFCMTGTPMMNNVDEFFSLIKFLRIKPYSDWTKFRLDISSPLKQHGEHSREKAMRMLQTLCKAVMLRRTKKSTFEGKPILILPERTTEVANPEFSEDEQNVYKALETQTQLQFNRYLRNGTVGSSYSAILVLLLRLRQACCHPHLIKDFGVRATADVSQDDLIALAKELSPQAIARIKETNGNFECPVCYDAVDNPAIFIPCGHDTCTDCFAKIADPSNAIRDGNEGTTAAKCPNCRGAVDPKRITDFDSFKKVHMPELLSQEDLAELEQMKADLEAEEDSEIESDDSETDSDDEDDMDAKGNLKNFIVKDDAEDSETASEAEEDNGEAVEGAAGPSKKSSKPKSKSKGKKSKKAKGKAKEKEKGKKKKKRQNVTMAELKAAANRNAKSRRAYIRRLREDWISSTKIEKTMETLKEIMENTDGEKVLVFSQWTSFLDLLEVPIDGEGWGYRRYDGSMNAKMRGDAVDEFRDPRKDVRIMLVSLKAGNAGLNLNMANHVVIEDPFWNPYIEEQAIDRAHRLGQNKPVTVHRMLIQGTVEDRIIELQEKKRALISEALDEKASQNIARLGVQELAYLFGVTRDSSQRVQYTPRDAR